MKISFSTLACPKWSFNKIVDEAQKNGYDGIEIRGIEGKMNLIKIEPFLPENLQNTLLLLQEKKIEISCLDTSCSFHIKKNFQKSLKEGKEAIDLAQKLNCRFIRVFGNNIPDPNREEEIISQIASGLSELVDYTEGKNVTVLIENHGEFSQAEKVLKLLKKVNRAGIGVLWDVTNAYTDYGEDIEVTFNGLRNYIRHTHVKDAKGIYPNAELCLIGQGNLSVKKMIGLLKSQGYDGWLSLEWEKMWHPELEEPEVVVPLFINHVKQYL